MAHLIKALLSLYDEAYIRHKGVKAPIKPGRDGKLAKQLLAIYTLEQLGEWLDVFMRHPDPFIQNSGHGFNIFSACIGKCITASKPRSPEDVQLAANRKIVSLIKDGMDRREAIQQVSREMGWIK